MNPHAKKNTLYTAITAILMIWCGWFTVFEDTTSVTLFVWTLRLGGIGMVAVALLCFMGMNAGLLMDAIISGLCGVIMVLCGLDWLRHDGFKLFDFIIVVFGVMFVRAAWTSWTLVGASAAQEADAKPPPPEPVHPASLHPDSLPKDGEPSPPNGYLAALADEKQEPPTASYE